MPKRAEMEKGNTMRYEVKLTLTRSYNLLAPIAALLIWFGSAQAQMQPQNVTDGTTPPAIAPGAPLGTYSITDMEIYNPFSGGTSLQFTAAVLGGRGSISYPLILTFGGQKWTVDKSFDIITGQPIYTPLDFQWSSSPISFFKLPRMLARRVSNPQVPCPNPGDPGASQTNTLTRLTYTSPDGTEYEFRDTKSGGTQQLSSCANGGAKYNRERVFKTADGTAATFIAANNVFDATNQWDDVVGMAGVTWVGGDMYLRDGTQYHFSSDDGYLQWIRDRNGNKITFSYTVISVIPYVTTLVTITDPLKRKVEMLSGTTDPQYGFGTQITFRGFGGTERKIFLTEKPLSQALRTTQPGDSSAVETYFGLFGLNASYVNPYDPYRTTDIWLPDGRRFQFFYNVYGDVARVVFPTGGVTEYDWTGGVDGSDESGVFWGAEPFIYRRVVAKRVYLNTSLSSLISRTSYSRIPLSIWTSPLTVTVEQKDAGGNTLSTNKHKYYTSPLVFMNQLDPLLYAPWNDGKENETELLSGSGSPLRKITNDWQLNASGINPRIMETTTTLLDVSPNLVSKQRFDYDDYNNVKDIWEHDYGSDSPPTHASRHTHIDYLTTNSVNSLAYDTPYPINPASPVIHLRNLPSKQVVYAVNPANGVETRAAQTEYEYDKYDPGTAYHANLLGRSDISGMDSAYTATNSNPARGNVTMVTRYKDAVGLTGAITTFQQYDVAGNVLAAVDAGRSDGSRSTTTFAYDDRFGSPSGEARANDPLPEPGASWLGGLKTYAFPIKVTNQLGHETYTQFDYFLGRPVDREDLNGTVSSFSYDDDLDRLSQVVRAANQAAVKTQVTFSYDDSNRTITTTADRDNFNDNLLQKKILYDGLGRTWRTATYEGASLGWSIIDTEFDALGRVYRISNPYRATGVTGEVNPSGVWTTTIYDALDRVIETQAPDGAKMRTEYSGARVLATEPYNESLPLGQQNRKQRIGESDALGRLKSMWEIKGADSATEGVTFPGHSEITAGYKTTYQYDALDNLTTVTQRAGTGGTLQTRSFVYDSLKRLTSVTNPESGLTTYVYDPSGNLINKTDARGITATFAYDALNRLTGDSYSSYPNGSAGSVYVYDNPDPSRNGKGRLWHNYSYTELPGGELKYPYNFIDTYDALGRPTVKRQSFLTRDCVGCSYYTKDYTVTRTYDRAGNVKSQTYPSGRTVNYSYDIAGRLSEFKGRLGGTPTDVFYAKDIHYNARGQMTREELGVNPGSHHTALYHRMYYNRRGQMFDTRLGTDDSSAFDVEDPAVWGTANGTWNRGAIRLFYSASLNEYTSANPSQPDNNGNIHRMDHFVPNALDGSGNITSWVLGADGYVYDELNRLTQVGESPFGGSGPGFTQKFIYDRWGNRKIDTVATSNVGGGVTDIDFQVSATNNRLLAPTDTGAPTDKMRYDAAGNLIWDEYSNPTNPSRELGYDVNNRIGVVKNSLGVELARYLYDPDGRRVRRIIGGVETWMVYGIDGELIAEYAYNASTGSPQKEYGYRNGNLLVVWDSTESGNRQLQWLVSDHLGSPRMVVDRSGEVSGIRRRDFLPFGEELASSIGHRNAAGAGYIADNVRQKFGSYERDNETGLDFAQARFFASVQGRFTSIDPLLASARPWLPQSWNRYAYSLNRPLSLIDPTGLIDEDPDENLPAYDQARQTQQQRRQQRQRQRQPKKPPTPGPPAGVIVEQTKQQNNLNGEPLQYPNGATSEDKYYGFGKGVTYTVVDKDGTPVDTKGMTLTEEVKIDNYTPEEAKPLAEGIVTEKENAEPLKDGKFGDEIGPLFKERSDYVKFSRFANFELNYTQTLTVTTSSGEKIQVGTNKITITNYRVEVNPVPIKKP